MRRPIAQPVRTAKARRRLLLVSQITALAAAAITFFAVIEPGPIRLGLFLVVAQPAIVVAVVLYVVVALSEFLASRGVSRLEFDAGEVIFNQGDPADCMYAVISGEVEVVREDEGREPTVIARLGPGQSFGELALLSSAPRMATVRAATRVELAAMGGGDFATLYAYVPDFQRSIEDAVRRRQG